LNRDPTGFRVDPCTLVVDKYLARIVAILRADMCHSDDKVRLAGIRGLRVVATHISPARLAGVVDLYLESMAFGIGDSTNVRWKIRFSNAH
jgi:hypothetical protein